MPPEKIAPPQGPITGGRGPSTPEHVFRRRRAAAAIVAVALLALLAAALGSHGGHRGGPAHGSASGASKGALSAQAAATARAARTTRTLKAENRAIDSILAYTPVVVRGGGKGHEVALTFDDGPGPYTQQVVAALDRLHAQATFFTVGSQEHYFSAGTAAELQSGDAVEDHSETHPLMSSLSPHDQYEQLFEPIARIELAGGPRPRLFRPPYGAFNATTFHELHHLRLLMVLWSVDTGDYAMPGVEAIVQRALAGAVPGAIILMHDAGGDRSQTIAALPAIVAGLRKRGLHPVTVPRLLLDDPPPAGQPIPTSLTGG
jgi:peptidoglycan/xylan/chitin deacetylase (PgdA/CDA1 family)